MRRTVPALLAAGLLLGLPARAEPPDDASRDEAILGGPKEAEGDDDAPADRSGSDDDASSDEAAGGRDEAILGGGGAEENARDAGSSGGEAPEGDGTADRLADRLREADDPLELGGRLYMRLNYQALEEGDPESFPLSSPSFLDVYLDGRPTDRLRAFARGRLSYDPTVRGGGGRRAGAELTESASVTGGGAERTAIELDQLWLKFDVGRKVFVTVGRQPVRWGTGRFWNPTDFLNARFRDPVSFVDERLGRDLVKVHVPIETLGWNLYAFADLREADQPERIGGALRAEMLFGRTELALTVHDRKGSPLGLGAAVSSAAGPLEVKGEVAVLHGVREPKLTGTFDLGADPPSPPELSDREGEWLPRAVLGVEGSFRYDGEDNVFLGAEYFYNDLGYGSAELYPALVLAQSAPEQFRSLYPELGAGDPVPQLTPLYTGRHYGAAFATIRGMGRNDDHNLIASTLANLSDRTYLSRLDYRARLLGYLRLNVFANVQYGTRGELNFGLDVPAEAIPGRDEPISVPSPLLQLGIGLLLDI